MSRHFNREMDRMKENIVSFGEKVGRQVNRAVNAVAN